ncbi:hypothetical protein [Caulobacter mirabilis]|uniref:DUF885 domain-containing protein n=1 Tax=Caulobacter mirabilis TaxID=69666 RepID=A0A2D2B1C8_9CAUL|nr:hypothetical protein [Caulobacter mirabilis]ATQ44070.1 hypothetical protein CSW64_17580 [Caulobacter mirabilis]
MMNRRQALFAAVALSLTAHDALARAPQPRTRWKVRTSEGFDALCFLGPLSGKPFYADYYREELAAFLPGMSQEAMAALASLYEEADRQKALLGPNLCTYLSGGPDATLDQLIDALEQAETVIKPPLDASPYALNAEEWRAFMAQQPRVLIVLKAMRDAGFGAFRRKYVDERAARRVPALGARLAGTDVITEQERLLGRRFADPSLEVILLYFSKPHGIKIQGQRFLTHLDYPDEAVIRNAAHEMLHPPFPMDGPLAKSVMATMNRDPLLTRVLAEHDPAFGYNSMEGILNEDTVQALEQIVSERLGVAKPAGERWRASDDGMHLFAAALYGMLKADGYDRTGGNIETWMDKALAAGRLSPKSIAGSASKVLDLPADQLWKKA